MGAECTVSQVSTSITPVCSALYTTWQARDMNDDERMVYAQTSRPLLPIMESNVLADVAVKSR